VRPRYPSGVTLSVEFDREEDGRFIADIPALPGCIVYGATREEALEKVKALALHVVADMLEHGELPEPIDSVVFALPTAA
jgi:predicted RNase H-like HicB family nuclease